jgi:hypothetical protein
MDMQDKVNFTPQMAQGKPIPTQRTCIRPECNKPLSGRQRLYCSKSHLVMVRNEARKAQAVAKRREDRLIARMDTLDPKERRTILVRVGEGLGLGTEDDLVRVLEGLGRQP